MPKTVHVWSNIASFELPLIELEIVFVIASGTISLKKSGNYADTLANALAKVTPGRFTLFGAPTFTKSDISFRFVKPCYLKTKCQKKWKTVCIKEAVLNGKYEFVVYTNDIDCEYTQQHPVPRPLNGESEYVKH